MERIVLSPLRHLCVPRAASLRLVSRDLGSLARSNVTTNSRGTPHAYSSTLILDTRPRIYAARKQTLGTAGNIRMNSFSVGAEPGLDLKTEHHPFADRESEIKVIDFSSKQVVEQDVPNNTLQNFLREQPRPDWAACRWISVNGLNSQVLKSLAEDYGLHRLSIEDVLDTNTPTKVDWYDNYCFMELTMQKLVVHPSPGDAFSTLDQSDPSHDSQIQRRKKWRTLAHRRYAIELVQASIFLTSDNTVITFFEHSGDVVMKPILTRLRSPQTIIRSSNDASMLVQAVVDVVVDMSVPINKAVDEMFGKLESEVLSSPTILLSKHLYILRMALTLLMDNLIATGGLVRTLIDHRKGLDGTPSNPTTANDSSPPTGVHISPTAQIYFQDVNDHINALSSSTHNSVRSAENLTSLIFNSIAASQNESVRSLTLISSFFLPLTFLTGYFGMNFEVMPVVNDHSDLTFWLIAVPVMSVTAILLLGARIIRPSSWTVRSKLRKLWRGKAT